MSPATASDPSPLTYTQTEIESYLPSGWRLAGDPPEGSWDPRRRVWRVRVLDGVRFEWPLEIPAAATRDAGRLGALRDAVDRVFRQRLGKPTRGLGVG